ncbi:MAG: AAA family ATPase [Candidatus Hodarchaeales archaeon]|jgi:MoxR-like ATPase
MSTVAAAGKKGEDAEVISVTDIQRVHDRILEEVGKVVIGNIDPITFLWICMLTNKHAYLEGVPGVAKTHMAKNFSSTMGCEFSRIQFTPDMLPSDIVGTNIFNPKTGTFRLKKGPIFGNVILADEVNRAPPKTQSAMLEAMAEGTVSIEGETHKLQKPFVVIATANPVEQEGTYPLPEAQLDRFLVKLEIEYGTPEDELAIIAYINNPIDIIVDTITSPETIVKMGQAVRSVYVSEDVMGYIRDIIVRTREDARLVYGASPRASISVLQAGKALAACRGRNYVIPDDVKFMIKHVLYHRLIMKPEAELEGITSERIALDIQNEVPVPVDIIEEIEDFEEEDEDWED